MNEAVRSGHEYISVFEHFTRIKPSMNAFRRSFAGPSTQSADLQIQLTKSHQLFRRFAEEISQNSPKVSTFEATIVDTHSVIGAAEKAGLTDLVNSSTAVYEHLSSILDLPDADRDIRGIRDLVNQHLLLLERQIYVAPTSTTGVSNSDATLSSKTRHILVIEDDEIARDLIKHSLSLIDCNITEAAKGFEALEILKTCAPDVIVLDVGLPDISGFSVLKLLKEWPKKADIPVIMLTGRSDVDGYVTGLARGAIDYITKPVDMQELNKRIVDVLDHNRLRQNSK